MPRRAPDPIAPLLLTPREAARAVGVSRPHIYKLMASGEVPSITLGKQLRIPVDALRAMVAQKLAAKEDER